MADPVERFIALLQNSPVDGAVFNPWWEVDRENDITSEAPRIRREQLTNYLQDRLGRASIALIGEALGYRGGHFTGIPMTSEPILLSQQQHNLVLSVQPRRTSKPSLAKDGFAEPTATIVWNSTRELEFQPYEFVRWNAFPWHPFQRQKGMLSNPCPNPAELDSGLPILNEFLNLFSCSKVIALGRFGAAQIVKAGFPPLAVRHPASGGARRFQGQLNEILRDETMNRIPHSQRLRKEGVG